MLNLSFCTDDKIMARFMISTSRMPIKLANELWVKYKADYQALQRDINSHLDNEAIIFELIKSDFFKQLKSEASKNCKRIEKLWQSSSEKINSFLVKICKKQLYLSQSAIIVAPFLCAAGNIGNNRFLWGHNLGLSDSNYDLVYLVHEALHSYFPNGTLTHAIIEYIADVELCKYLNSSPAHYPTHDYTNDYRVKIFPYWNLYLNQSEIELLKRQKEEKIYYKVSDFEKYRDTLKELDIDKLVDFLKEHINEIDYETSYQIVS